MPSANPLRCPGCKEGLMEGRFWPWKHWLAPILMLTIILLPLGLLLKARPDYYECPKCGRKKGTLWT